MYVARIGVAHALAASPDLQDKLPLRCELEDHVVAAPISGRRIPTGIAGNPNKPSAVYMNSVFTIRPFVPGGQAAPAANQSSRRIELQHARRGADRFSGGTDPGRCKTQMWLWVRRPPSSPRPAPSCSGRSAISRPPGMPDPFDAWAGRYRTCRGAHSCITTPAGQNPHRVRLCHRSPSPDSPKNSE